ncbi:MAG TPA: tetratricopeptide repeat protein, partial [Gammaproteobacteria bacterium]|nr:tetratricopeptide repeat protein [Gammaproteobacteria bacterium]
EVAIRTFQERIKQNPKDAVSYAMLGEQYSRQARETGDVSGYQRSEKALHQSLDLLPNYAPAETALASIYYAQHEFSRSLELAAGVYQSNYKNAQARIIVADSYLSLGQYQDAEKIYNELGDTNVTPPLLARLANLDELKGNSDQALRLIRRAAGETLQSGGTRENAAWYLLRVGDIYYNRGEIKEAGEFYEAALRVFDDYYLAYAGLGKVRAAEEKYDEAIAYYQKAVNIIPQPDFLAALGDLYIVTGQPEQAKMQYETVEYIGKLAAINQQVYNRQLANFYSDHDVRLEEALKLALNELKDRKDIYGYDAAAWAYYKNGKYQEAQDMMDHALAMGTQDARLFYHAGMIAHALHQDEQARQYLQKGLAINRHFSVLFAEQAQKTLLSI